MTGPVRDVAVAGASVTTQRLRAEWLAAATEWAFVFPSGWSSVPLRDEAAIERHVRSIVVGRLGRADRLAATRRDVRENLLEAARGAARAGGLSLTVFSMPIAGVPISGTMAVFPFEASDADRDALVASIAASAGAPGVAVDKQALPDGWVLRAVRQSEIERTDEEGNPVLPELRADYWTERRELGRILQVSFTTPFIPLRGAMVDLFDSVTLSLHPVVRG